MIYLETVKKLVCIPV